MSRLPDKFLIVRHGARLDETMPAEMFREVDVGYDTPLTYGGFKQSQALGAYIAQLLLLPGNPDRRKKRIVIHSSPFARCIQTSIGIAAGIAQVVPPAHGINPSDAPGPSTSSIASPYSRIALKVDPWLGEWMTEEYFGHWDAALLRSSDVVARARTLLTSAGEAEGIRMDPKMLDSQALILGNKAAQEVPAVDALNIQSLVSARGKTYVAPKPNHAVLATDAIPKGYVAHARDGCIDFDQTWFGLRDGGEYGEDWAVFHRRIGAGIEALLQWFLIDRYDATLASRANNSPSGGTKSTKDATDSEHIKNNTKRLSDMSLESITEDERPEVEDDDEELIVILVTHAGGCNKLLHFFTHKPVLIDFPQLSLTLALKKPEFEGAGELDTLFQQYKVVMQASTDHLNPAAKFKTIKDLASANIEITRHSRSTSRSNRRTTLTSVPSVATGPHTGLWGQTRSPDSKTTSPSVSTLWGQARSPDSTTASPSVSTLWGQTRPSRAESGSVSAIATTFESSQESLHNQTSSPSSSQRGLWRPGGAPVRRATFNDVRSATRE